MKRSTTALTASRDQWIKDICEGLADSFRSHTVLGDERISGELGDPALLRALLITRITVLQARGQSAVEVIAQLADTPVFADPKPGPDELSPLVRSVHRRMGQDGVTGWVLLLGLGLRVDSPESTHRLLLDFWVDQRARVVTEAQLRRELKTYWAAEDLSITDFGVPRSLASLGTYSDFSSRLKEEPDKQAANFAALGLIHIGHKTLERWLKQFPAHKARHLQVIGSDRAQCVGALRYLRAAIEHPKLDDELRPIAIRALALVEDQLERASAAVEHLSTVERDLMRDRTEEQSFREGCAIAFLNWSMDREPHACYSNLQTVHGTWGPMPWWSITARNSDEVEAATASRDEGVLPLGFELDPTEPNLFVLICRKPRTGTTGMLARFVFDLDNPAHACELLLIGRRRGVPIDLYAEPMDEWDLDTTHVGTLHAPVGRELAQFITEIATEALSEMLPGSRSQAYDTYDGIPALTEALQQSDRPLAWGYSPSRRINIAPHHGRPGSLQLLTTDPPVSMTGFFRHSKEGSPKEGGKESEGTHRTAPQGIGFVYVQRNPAFPEMLKIGYTHQLAEDRAKALSDTSVPYPFEVLYRVSTTRAVEVERAVHHLLAAHRASANREFFGVSLDTAVKAIHHCQHAVTGIHTWASLPSIHRLRSGDRVVLPLQAGQVFALTAWPNLFSQSAGVLDLWQAHSDGDLLEIHATHHPGHVAGFSDNDPGGDEDPVPFLDRDGTVRNRTLMGRERLVAGDRLVWLSDREGPENCRSVVFEATSFCQVTYRTSSPQSHPSGIPLLLNSLEREPTPAMRRHVREALGLPLPRTWAPRSSQPGDEWARPAMLPQPPEYWLPQLRNRRGRQ